MFWKKWITFFNKIIYPGIMWVLFAQTVGSLSCLSMLGAKSGFTTLVKKRSPHIISTHCALHRHALASKILPEYLKAVLKHVIECVNFIRARALNHRLFKVVQFSVTKSSSALNHLQSDWLVCLLPSS